MKLELDNFRPSPDPICATELLQCMRELERQKKQKARTSRHYAVVVIRAIEHLTAFLRQII